MHAMKWSSLSVDHLLQATRDVAPIILAERDAIERSRGLSPELIAFLRDAGLFSLWLPRTLGGPDLTVWDFVRVIEAIARIDGSAGWCTAIGACLSRLAGYLTPSIAEEIYGAGNAILAGTLNPTGRAIAVTGGYRVTGQWSYGSGIGHSNWVVGNCLVFDGDMQRKNLDGSPVIKLIIVPKRDVEVLDTWRVSGLRGTGSHDFRINDIFVPEARSVVVFGGLPAQSGNHNTIPLITVFAVSIVGVPLGLARGAIDALTELAESKTPTGATQPLKNRPNIQADIGRAEAEIGSARAFLFQTMQELSDAAEAGEPSLRQRAMVRLACAQATTASKRVVDLMFEAGGGTSLYEDGRLARYWRDAHAAAQHIALSATNYELSGRVLLGMDPGTARF